MTLHAKTLLIQQNIDCRSPMYCITVAKTRLGHVDVAEKALKAHSAIGSIRTRKAKKSAFNHDRGLDCSYLESKLEYFQFPLGP